MIPLDLKKDKDGLLYLNDKYILTRTPLLLDHRTNIEYKYYQNGFYRISGVDDYIVKYSYTGLTKKEIEKMKEMLINLVINQKNVPDVDFPIGYYKSRRKLDGLIIKYYPEGISFDNILNEKDIITLSKYYYHNEDGIHNLFLLFDEVLKLVYEMFECDIYYTDINPGNIMFDQNKVKIIDFEPNYVLFDEKDKRLKSIIYAYYLLIKESLNTYNLAEIGNSDCYNFETAKQMTKKLENSVRKNSIIR